MKQFLINAINVGVHANDDEKLANRKQLLNALAYFMSMGGIVWGVICVYFDLYYQSLIPFGYTFVSIFNLLSFNKFKKIGYVRFIQVLISLMLPFMLQWSLGGFIPSGAVMLWSLLSLVGSISFQDLKQSKMWLLAFVALIVFSGFTDSYFAERFAGDMSDASKVTLFVINISIITVLVVSLTLYFIGVREKANRELKEIMVELRNNSKQISEQKIEIEKSYENIKLLSEIGQKITSNITIEEIFSTTLTEISKIFTINNLLFTVVHDNKLQFYKSTVNGKIEFHRDIAIIEDQGYCIGKTFTNQEVVYFENQIVKEIEYGSVISIPLALSGNRLGVLSVQSSIKSAFNKQIQNIFSNISVYVSIALVNANSFEKIDIQKKEISIANIQLNQQKEELQTSLDNLKEAQAQLVQSEKMASLGQLIAGIAHEINTPIGAIRASIKNISDSLEHTGEQIPKLIENLSKKELCLFFKLVKENKSQGPLTSREERKFRREVLEILEDNDVEEADILSDTLVDMRVFEPVEYLELLKSSDSSKIMETAYHYSTLYSDSNNILSAVDKASKIVFSLKKFAHREHDGEKHDSNLIENLETVLTLYHNQIKQGIELIRDFEDIPTISCHADELNQVWTNLIHNALQAMEYKGKLVIAVKNTELEIDSKLNKAVMVSVTDDGCGIPEEIQEKIFTVFFTTKKQGEGTGLGLDFVKKIIEKHNGKITVDSKVGVGSTFSVIIPII